MPVQQKHAVQNTKPSVQTGTEKRHLLWLAKGSLFYSWPLPHYSIPGTNQVRSFPPARKFHGALVISEVRSNTVENTNRSLHPTPTYHNVLRDIGSDCRVRSFSPFCPFLDCSQAKPTATTPRVQSVRNPLFVIRPVRRQLVTLVTYSGRPYRQHNSDRPCRV